MACRAPESPDSAFEHFGRKRRIPHTEGVFASFVFIPVKPSKVCRQTETCVDLLDAICCRVQQQQQQQQQEEEQQQKEHLQKQQQQKQLQRVQPWYYRPGAAAAAATDAANPKQKKQARQSLNHQQQHHQKQQQQQNLQQPAAHLSLSRLLLLQYHLLDPFVEALQKAVKDIQSFTLIFPADSVCFLSNEDHSRLFVALPVASPNANPQVEELLLAVDSVVTAFGFEGFWRPFRPHVSLASTSLAVGPALSFVKGFMQPSWAKNNRSKSNSNVSTRNSEDKTEGFYLLLEEPKIKEVFKETINNNRRLPQTWFEVDRICVTTGKRTTEIKLKERKSFSEGPLIGCLPSSSDSSEADLTELGF